MLFTLALILGGLDLEQIEFKLESKNDFEILPTMLFLKLRHPTLQNSDLWLVEFNNTSSLNYGWEFVADITTENGDDSLWDSAFDWLYIDFSTNQIPR